MDAGAHKGIPAFSAVLLTVALALAGLALLPRVTLQYLPSVPEKGITVSFSYPGATPESAEAEVTSVLEGALSGIRGCRSVTSTSRKGGGNVRLSFHKKTDMAAVRFEVASRIRNLWPGLPDGVTYPSLSVGTDGTKSRQAISFVLKGNLPSESILRFVQAHLLVPVSQVDGVSDVQLRGATPYIWDVTLDSDMLAALGMHPADVASALDHYYGQSVSGLVEDEAGWVPIRFRGDASPDFGEVPIGVSGGRTICLRDVATWRYRESEPEAYYRENGLNTITMAVYIAADVNLLQTVREVREAVRQAEASFPGEITASVGYDASEYVQEELQCCNRGMYRFSSRL